MAREKTLYEILEVDVHASQTVIQGAYRALLKDGGAHPDLGGHQDLAQAINEAYGILSNPDTRRQYDETLSRQREEQPLESDNQYVARCPHCKGRTLVRMGDSPPHCQGCKKPLQATGKKPKKRTEKDDARAYRVGLYLFEKGMYERARFEFQAAVRINPRKSVYHYWLGRCFYQRKILENARGAFKSAAILEPERFHYQFWLGQTHYALNEWSAAAEGFQAAAALREGHMPTLLKLGTSYFRLHAYEEAARVLDEAVTLAPTRIQPLTWLGLTHFAGHRFEQALEAFQRAHRINPANATVNRYITLSRKEVGG